MAFQLRFISPFIFELRHADTDVCRFSPLLHVSFCHYFQLSSGFMPVDDS